MLVVFFNTIENKFTVGKTVHWNNRIRNTFIRIKLKWFSTYLLNASLKGLDHFILIHEYTNTRIHEYTNTRIRLFE